VIVSPSAAMAPRQKIPPERGRDQINEGTCPKSSAPHLSRQQCATAWKFGLGGDFGEVETLHADPSG